MNKELRRCPFCGGEGELWNNKLTYRLYGVICEECDCMTPYFTTREEAIEAWNRRKPLEDIVEQLEESYSCDVGTLQMISLDTAIEIVKTAGVDNE